MIALGSTNVVQDAGYSYTDPVLKPNATLPVSTGQLYTLDNTTNRLVPTNVRAESIINPVNKTQAAGYAYTAGNIMTMDASGNMVDSGKNVASLITNNQNAPLPGSSVSFINFVNQPLGNQTSMGVTAGSPVYFVMRSVTGGTITANEAVGCNGSMTFVGLNPGNMNRTQIVFARIQDKYINRAIVLSGAGTNGYQGISVVEPIFARNMSTSVEYMVFRVTSNDSDGAVRFQGDSINKFIETTPLEILSQNAFSAKYAIFQDCNTCGEDQWYNVGYEQITGRYWTTSDNKRYRIFRATYRFRAATEGATATFERQWATLNNIYLFLGFDPSCSLVQGTWDNGLTTSYFPLQYYDAAETLVISTAARIQSNTLRLSTKINCKDGGWAGFNFAPGFNNGVATFYYTKSNDVF
jgi:hypothetical protein